MNQEIKGYSFIGEILKTTNVSSYEITEGYRLKKANVEQIIKIKKCIPKAESRIDFTSRYEVKTKEITQGNFEFIPLVESEWNYWIIEHDSLQPDHDFKISLLLSKIGLNCLFDIVYIGNTTDGGMAYNPQMFHNYLTQNNMMFKEVEVNDSDLEEIKETFCLIKEIKNRENEFKYINKAIDDLYNLELLPKTSTFRIVGIFSILESLLVHNPLKGDSSITQQLKMKLNLLNNRFDEKVNYIEHFNCPNSLPFSKLVEKLYSYRSDVAHGDFADFNNDLQVIVNKIQAEDFLYQILKKVITLSLKEPQLIHDLKFI